MWGLNGRRRKLKRKGMRLIGGENNNTKRHCELGEIEKEGFSLLSPWEGVVAGWVVVANLGGSVRCEAEILLTFSSKC